MLVSQDSDAFQSGDESPPIKINRAAKTIGNQLAVIGIGPFQGATRHHLIGSEHDDLINVEIRRYMRDVLDHTIKAAERIASYDELLSSLVQAALGKVAMQQNIDMRKISAWVAIAAVPTALAGIYGMNFEDMPELDWAFGYPTVLLVMVTVCLLLYRTFRRNNWL